MNGCNKFIEQIVSNLPEICHTRDLIKAKVFKSRDAAWRARLHEDGPAYIQLSPREIIYTKEAVLEWLKSRHHVPKWATEKENFKNI